MPGPVSSLIGSTMPVGDDRLVDGALRLLRTHLGLDVAFVSQLTDGQRIFRHVDADDESVVSVGDAGPAETSYCHYVTLGQVPQFLADPADHPVTRQLSVTAELPVGTHFSVPLTLSDGTVYGTFCGFSHQVIDSLSERDLDVVGLLAAMVVGQIEQEEFARRAQLQRRSRLLELAAGRDLVFAAQPIHDLTGRSPRGELVGYELLARFPMLGEGPSEVFADAWRLGIGVDLELATITMALDTLQTVPAGLHLAVNLAPDTVIDDQAQAALVTAPAGRLVVEITEHAPVGNYPVLQSAIDRLKSAGVGIAIDDVGTGFSGLDHILRLEPNILKLDGALVRGIDRRPGKQAMVAALVTFADKVDAAVVAEQVETPDELTIVQELGVSHAQGYLLGRPAALPTLQTPRAPVSRRNA